MSKVFRVGKHRPQHAAGGRVLDAAMVFAVEVGRREMHTAISGVGAGADCRRIGHPHARRRATGNQQRHVLTGSLLDHLLIAAGKTQLTQTRNIRTFLRCQHALGKTHVHQRLHFCQALQRRFTRVRALLAITLRGDVTVGQPAVVVGWPDQTVKIHFTGLHRQGSVDLFL